MKTKIVRGYLDQYINLLKNGSMNKSQLAKIIMAKEPGLFKSFDDARCCIKECTVPGSHGIKVDPEHLFISNQKHGVQSYFDRKSDIPKTPKILLFDLETLPIVSYHWGVWDQNIPHIMRLKDWCIVTWSAKWLFESTTYSYQLTPSEAKKRNDKRICRSLWKMFEQADVLIAHNLKKFDRKRANTRFILNGLKPPSPYSMIDTLLEARKHFAFDWNKLDYLGDILVNKKKIKTDFDLWRGCDNGDQDCLDQMSKYNNVDVLLLEEVYEFLRPWIKSHPNLAVYDPDKEKCVYCLCDKLKTLPNFYATPAGRFQSMRCTNCGGINRSRYSDLKKGNKKNLLTSTAR